jgi:hypothetical protein
MDGMRWVIKEEKKGKRKEEQTNWRSLRFGSVLAWVLGSRSRLELMKKSKTPRPSYENSTNSSTYCTHSTYCTVPT